MNHNPSSSFNLYHGTTQENIKRILETKQFTVKPRIDHWLGHGVYFFVDDISKALWWSEMATRRFHESFENRGIIFIEGYKIKRDKLFDLDSEKDRKVISEFLKSNPMTLRMKLTSKEESERMIEARAQLINIIVDYYEKHATKYTFHKDNIGEQGFLANLNINNNETQFCIVDTSSINFDDIQDITQEVI